MGLNKIPSFQEVKDWANNTFLFDHEYDPEADTHSRYGDNEARSAVDNSNVSVGYADNAGALGGQPPSNYETPANTDSTFKQPVNTKVGGGDAPFTINNIDMVADQIEVENNYNESVEVDVYINGSKRVSNGFISDFSSEKWNIEIKQVNSVEIQQNSGRSGTTYSVFLGQPAVGPHSHPLP